MKLYELVDDPATAELVSWDPSDETQRLFTVHKPTEFSRDVLPRYFKHENLTSFIRQYVFLGGGVGRAPSRVV